MKPAGALIALIFSPAIFASEIISSNNIEILAVDGKEIKTNFFSSSKIQVTDGEHQVVARYSRNFNKDGLVESKPYIFTVNVQGDTSLKMNKFSTPSHAKSAINKGLTWSYKNDQGEVKVQHADQLKGDGFMPYSDIEALVATYNQQHAIQPSSTTTSAKPTNNTSSVSDNPIIEQYKLASKAQRKAFKIWLIDNETK